MTDEKKNELISADFSRAKEVLIETIDILQEENLDDFSCALAFIDIGLQGLVMMGGTIYTYRTLGEIMSDLADTGPELEMLLASESADEEPRSPFKERSKRWVN